MKLRLRARVVAAGLSVLVWKVRLAVFPCSPCDYGPGGMSSFCLRCGEYRPRGTR